MSTPAVVDRPVLTDEQLGRERSFAFAIVLDGVITAAMIAAGILGGSFTMVAESLRAVLQLVPEWFSYSLLRHIHRGEVADLEYGTGKLEQLATMVIAVTLLAAAAWIAFGVMRILSGDRALGSPMGLAGAAIVGAINLYANVVAWDTHRRVMSEDDSDSVIMKSQLQLRWTKLLASFVMGIALTIAALSSDDLIVEAADVAGATLVAIYMTVTAWGIIRSVVPELIDSSGGPRVRQGVQRSLALHAGDYVNLRSVRTRRTSHTAFVEVAIDYDGSLTLEEVGRRVESLKATMREETGSVEISIQTFATEQPQRPSSFTTLPLPPATPS